MASACAAPQIGDHLRLYLLAGFCFYGACVICLRLVYLQIFATAISSSAPNTSSSAPMKSRARRGIIYDRAGT